MKLFAKLLGSLSRTNSVLNPNYLNQFLASIAVNIIVFSHGIVIGWLSPTLHQLLSPHSPLDFAINIREASWIGSLLGIGSICGVFFYGFLIQRIGRKTCIYLMTLPHIALWLCVYFAQSVEYLYVGRFIAGINGGCTIVVLPFISDIADKSVRGRLSTVFMLAIYLGILLGFIIASFMSYHTMPIAMISLPFIYLICSVFIPESPQHLLQQNKTVAAEKAFKFYKNCNSKSSKDKIQQCEREFRELQSNLKEQQSIGTNVGYEEYFTKASLKAFSTAAVILVLSQFSGSFAFINYMSLIFEKTGSVLEPNTSTIIMGVASLLGIQGATMLVDHCGRKILLLFSCGSVFLLLTIFGAFVYIGSEQTLLEYNWLPVVLMSGILFFSFIGIAGITLVVIVEIFPPKIRSTGTFIAFVGNSVCIFMALKIFPLLMDAYGIAITLWLCASICLVSFIYLAIFLPETKHKSLDVE